MSKLIRLTPECIEECRTDFEKALSKAKLTDGKISFTKVLPPVTAKARVVFTPSAWAKMIVLITQFNKEIAWHGTARRIDSETVATYLIDDIVVYPQEVTGASVEMDTEKYAIWLQKNDDDERFQRLYMQGHSHVNIPPNPSIVDENHQKEILCQLRDTDFYIFMIWNKSLQRNIKIYDVGKNVLYEDSDIEVDCGDCGIFDFIKDAEKMVSDKKAKPISTYPTYGKAYTHTSPQSTTRKDKPRTKIGAGWAGKQCPYVYGDDYADPDSPYYYSER